MKLFARFRYEGATANNFWINDKTTVYLQKKSLQHKQVNNLTPTTASFTLNAIINENENNNSIFKDSVAPSIPEALLGISFALLVSGYTGSGKTHTMMGSESDR